MMDDFISNYLNVLFAMCAALTFVAFTGFCWLKGGSYGALFFILMFALPAVAAWVLS